MKIRRATKIEMEKGLVYVAEEDKKIIGYSHGVSFLKKSRKGREKEGKKIDIDVIFVNKEFRGRGIAGKLIEKTLKFVKEKFDKVWVSCPEILKRLNMDSRGRIK